MSTSLDEMMRRLANVTDSLSTAEREELAPDLFEVERSLGAARRRLSRIVDSGR